MTDELVKRLREAYPATQDFAHTMQGGLMDEAADRIEQLTGEVQRWQGMFDEKHNLMLEHKARAKTAEAERDRLREALEQFLIEYDVVDLANAEPSSLTAAVLDARAALKGEAKPNEYERKVAQMKEDFPNGV